MFPGRRLFVCTKFRENFFFDGNWRIVNSGSRDIIN